MYPVDGLSVACALGRPEDCTGYFGKPKMVDGRVVATQSRCRGESHLTQKDAS